MSKFFKSPAKILIALVIFLIILIALVAVFKLINRQPAPDNLQNLSQAELTADYHQDAKSILNQFLIDLKTVDLIEKNTCQNLIDSALQKILALTVPTADKKFHLETVVWLDKEFQNCGQPNKISVKNFEASWETLTQKNNWLIN